MRTVLHLSVLVTLLTVGDLRIVPGQTGIQKLRHDAEQGDWVAQYFLGLRYYFGDGFAQDHVKAAKWFRILAEQNGKASQFILGKMYSKGEGVEQDYVQAHVWLSLAALPSYPQGGENKQSAEARDEVLEHMTPAQLAQAQRIAREWKPKTWDELEKGLAAKGR